jgi:hypothetical protein
MDDLESRNAGLAGMGLPPGGNMNEWQAGRGIKTWNDNMLAANNQPVANTGYTPIVPAAPVWSGPNWSGPVVGGGATIGSGMRGAVGMLGLLLLIFVGAPLYYVSIPLWFALYPLPGTICLGVFVGAFMYFSGDSMFTNSGLFAAPFFFAFVTAWVVTLGDQIYARSHPVYRRLRHVARLGLIWLWAIYALSDAWVFTLHIKMVNPHLPPLRFSPTNIAIATGVTIAMHFWLLPKPERTQFWNRRRSKAGFQRAG